jgi:hypothetical protein
VNAASLSSDRPAPAPVNGSKVAPLPSSTSASSTMATEDRPPLGIRGVDDNRDIDVCHTIVDDPVITERRYVVRSRIGTEVDDNGHVLEVERGRPAGSVERDGSGMSRPPRLGTPSNTAVRIRFPACLPRRPMLEPTPAPPELFPRC